MPNFIDVWSVIRISCTPWFFSQRFSVKNCMGCLNKYGMLSETRTFRAQILSISETVIPWWAGTTSLPIAMHSLSSSPHWDTDYKNLYLPSAHLCWKCSPLSLTYCWHLLMKLLLTFRSSSALIDSIVTSTLCGGHEFLLIIL